MSTTTMSMKHDLQDKKSSSKQKRFKVGKACFTCRVKKIKCDGLQPCMQCKARSRPCTFSKDGSVLEAAQEQDAESLGTSPSPSTSRASTPPAANTHNSPKFKKPLPIDQKSLSSTTETLNRLNRLWPAEGKEGKWELDVTKLLTTTTRAKSSPSNDHTFGIELLPSKSIQHAHIQTYFKICYSIFPMIPKRIFFKQFDSPIQHYNASYLLSPILLLMVMAHGAQKTQDDECDSWFQHAKSIILQQQSNKPQLSTVIALALMSQFQSTYNPYPSMYSAMAFQMCRDLNLMRSYTGELDILYQDEMDGGTNLKELQKRVCWGCYALDKIIHLQTGQPWMLKSKEIDLDLPLLQPGDDITEHQILETFVCSIKLLQIAERTLHQREQQQLPIVRTHAYDQMALTSDNALLDWLRSLPPHLQWTPVLNNINSLTTPTSPSNIMVLHLHMLYNIIELGLLKPYVSSTVKSIQTRSAAVATHLIRLISTLIENQAIWHYNYDFTTYTLIESIKFHLGHCSCENLVLARHARFMFQQAMPTMKKLLPMIKTASTFDKIAQFVVNVENAITEADENAVANGVFAQDDMMTPFVLGSLNARYGDEERQQWSKLDYFASGLITPPTVKSKPSISMSSTMFAPPTMSSIHSYGANSHSAVTDNLFQPTASSLLPQQPHDWRTTPDRFKINNTNQPLEFLHNQHPPQWLPATTKKSSTSAVTAAAAAAAADTNSSDLTDIDALVAQIQENNNNNNSSPHSHSPSNDSSSSSTAANENDNLLYSLLSDRSSAIATTAATTATLTPTRNQSYSTFVQPYMNVGLGIYASAHQHHNDVIRQHLPLSSKGVLRRID